MRVVIHGCLELEEQSLVRTRSKRELQIDMKVFYKDSTGEDGIHLVVNSSQSKLILFLMTSKSA